MATYAYMKVWLANHPGYYREYKKLRQRRLRLDHEFRAKEREMKRRYRMDPNRAEVLSNRLRHKRDRDESALIIRDAKSRPCADCGQVYPPYVMDFDHVRGKKRFNIGLFRAGHTRPKEVLAEIAKCDVVCANCHRERTYGK
jgi:hypothetical protein